MNFAAFSYLQNNKYLDNDETTENIDFSSKELTVNINLLNIKRLIKRHIFEIPT